MHAQKWLSNSSVLKEVPQEDRLSKVDFNEDSWSGLDRGN